MVVVLAEPRPSARARVVPNASSSPTCMIGGPAAIITAFQQAAWLPWYYRDSGPVAAQIGRPRSNDCSTLDDRAGAIARTRHSHRTR